MPVNREYKDTVFTLIFRDPEAVLSLYNAVNGTEYDSAEGLQVNTLEDADGCRSGIFSRMRNDLSFIFAEQLNVYEHQSTVNRNMPIRMLFYVSSLFRRLINTDELYQSKAVTIQEPVFVVLYNGKAAQPEEEWTSLSSHYSENAGVANRKVSNTDEHRPALELLVRMININSGHNPDLIRRCKSLEGYVEFVRRSRYALDEVHGDFDRREAMEQVIDSCIRDGFLTEFLSVKENREAITMAEIWEYDEEAARRAAEADMREAIELAQKEGYKSGEARLSALISKLIEEHRMEDIAAAAKDPARREELYREYPDIT